MSPNPPPSGIVIPEEILARFPDLVELIKESESMNDEERQYWVNILPIMTPEQIQNLREILENEKKQLKEIDQKYSRTLSAEEQQELIARTEDERKARRMQRTGSEQTAEEKEKQKTEDLLKEIENL